MAGTDAYCANMQTPAGFATWGCRMLKVEWIDAGREPTAKPDPRYPKGVDLDMSKGRGITGSCRTELPYPAPRCGQYVITCSICGLSAMVTTAGRADDPRSVKVACKLN